MKISKSDYRRYLEVPQYLWLWKNDREKVQEDPSIDMEMRLEQGDLVEQYARKLFPDGILISGTPIEAELKTKEALIHDKKTLFQATAITDKFLAMADVLVKNEETGKYKLYEVKSSTGVDDTKLHDLCFQKITFEEAGYEIESVNLILLNSEYVKQGEYNIEQLFNIVNCDEEIVELEPTVKMYMEDAWKIVQLKDCPKIEDTCLPLDIGNARMRELCMPPLPEYSIFDISRIHKTKRQSLFDQGLLDICDVPNDFELSDKQTLQVQVAKTNKTLIDREGISNELGKLKFPLYFLDYETLALALPPIDGASVYQQIPFQYSLHVLRKPDGELEHYEYLARDFDNCVRGLLESLQKNCGTNGTVIVWNKGFEMGRNKEMAELEPEFATYLHELNTTVYDLMDVFSKQYYVDPKFKGSCSIKKVLPVLAPDLSYGDLDIGDGMTACVSWYLMAEGSTEGKKIYNDLLKYCCLDTLAMVRVWEFLSKIVS